MDIYLVWAGERSLKFATIFAEWIQPILSTIKPFFSKEIGAGRRWTEDISDALERSDVGIVFLTRDNLDSPWIHFEAGALSKNQETARVCQILFDGLKPEDITDPLSQFQISTFDPEGIRKLLGDLNGDLDDHELEVKTLDRSFEKWWPELEQSVAAVAESVETKEVRSERDMVAEILNTVRDLNAASRSRD